jgi:hypothetical protein
MDAFRQWRPAGCVLLVAAGASGLTACASSSATGDSHVAVCDASKVQWAVGKEATQDVMGQVWRQSGAGLFRPIIEAQSVQRDVKPDRVNVHLDNENRIRSIDCG